ncbi:MAG: hypothetical protein UV71_C0003G0017 [Microgenomates group bacterium GW2011_GWC1_43_13]|uniref:Uncharacterized protein n=3 Tax=Candidatus Woeseibacteriota TaxID=1752722 RepID=A0A837I9D8_9BACT|nr:MAG: hypothetical protein UV71_C0003G0017 [Microgenomates group bacterium GW2011_GWC1_43_13]KKT32716.1 MAG: hypothetical protein UW20_C0010G0018 [Candidatus Woesebacteria bacterium GW2011_GWB1_44_11]KKT54823.1 MAG: hypothetical protein UW47_C0002G0007 [Candidatus Woesebacteria bacterium GW2011_GWA1_44_23]OGM75986.1 MAG: hypothetical protein A2208_02820 [Candidatus Woesebacteria bacterium RIFOXYA1_FULL_43_16]OGM82506.1 MAG: hypothetical protein A2394_00020 [Candidatus Woesebacteria bacterium 
MLKTKKFQKGVTIVELIVYIGLLSIFMLVLVDVFVTILNSKLDTESTSTLNQDARYIYSRLAYDIANADSASVLNPNSLNLVSSGVSYNYVLDGSGNLLLNDVTINSLDTKVDSISFSKIGNTVKISYTIESLITLPSGNQTRTIETTVGLRP